MTMIFHILFPSFSIHIFISIVSIFSFFNLLIFCKIPIILFQSFLYLILHRLRNKFLLYYLLLSQQYHFQLLFICELFLKFPYISANSKISILTTNHDNLLFCDFPQFALFSNVFSTASFFIKCC